MKARVPPKLVRRLVLAPAVMALEVALVALSPALLLAALIASPPLGGGRPLRLTVIVLVFAARHLVALIGCFGLWMASGFGLRARSERMLRAHYALTRWFVAGVYRAAVRVANVEITVSESEAAERALSARERPAVVLCRHAGEGDTLLAVHHLLCRHDRGPRIVMHSALRLDPLIDVLGDRLPNRFIDPRGGDIEATIADMARELGGTGALLIFPEGTNFSPRRRQRGIDRLDAAGFGTEAEMARAMRHVSAPRPGGALAAIDAAPDVDVVIMGHAGFPSGLRELWRELPEPQTIDVRLWHESATAIPAERPERIAWLFRWWQTLDEWVEARLRARRGAASRRGERAGRPPA